jgi:hypothetical protein
MSTHQLIDFTKSHTVIRTTDLSWRQKITSLLEIHSTDSQNIKVESLFLNYQCLSEHVAETGDMLIPSHTWQAIIGSDIIKIFRRSAINLIQPQIINYKKNNSVYKKVELNMVCSKYSEIQIEKLSDSNNEIICCITYYLNNIKFVLYFEALYVNYFSLKNKFGYQIDVGPVIYSDSDNPESYNLAYCAVSNLKPRLEFNILTPISKFEFPFLWEKFPFLFKINQLIPTNRFLGKRFGCQY